jgi:hypothetical protein
MYNFKNSILIVVFNYFNCISNKDIIKTIYENHFTHLHRSKTPNKRVKKYKDVKIWVI